MKNAKRMTALILSLSLAASALTACGGNADTASSSAPAVSSEGTGSSASTASPADSSSASVSTGSTSGDPKEENSIKTTPVTYSREGRYTTTVSSDTVDLSGISIDNTEVFYPKSIGLTVESLEAMMSDDEEETSLTFNSMPVNVTVESVEANPEGGYDIAFLDTDAGSRQTGKYTINFTNLSAAASVDVNFPDVTLTPDIEFVTPAEKQFKVTLTADGDEFADSIKKSDIELSGNFSGLKIASLSASGKNLTMQLKGSIRLNEAGVYQWGEITIGRQAFKNGYQPVNARIDVKATGAWLDSETLTVEDGRASADLKVYGVADAGKLTKENVSIDGLMTETVEKADDTTVKVTFSAPEAKTAADFADLASGREMTVGDYKTNVGLSQATFYPVFDYIEEDGGSFRLTLKLYAIAGTFDQDLAADAVSFGNGLANAKLESVKADSDSVATVVFTTAADGQKLDGFSLDGTVILAPGALVNAWGEGTTNAASFFREYSNESLGKEVTLNTETLEEIQKYCAGKDTVFGQILSAGSTIGTVASIASSVLQALGIVKSEHTQVMEQFAEINRKVDIVLENQNAIRGELMQFKKQGILNQVEPYEAYLNTVIDHTALQFAYLKRGALYMACEQAVKKGRLDAMPNFGGLFGADLQAALQSYEQYLPDLESMKDDPGEAGEYIEALLKYINKRVNDGDTEFSDFDHSYRNLKDSLEKIANLLIQNTDKNPVKMYDQIASVCYNFDTQSYDYRLSHRVIAMEVLLSAAEVLIVRQNIFKKADAYFLGSGKGGMYGKITAAINQINQFPVEGIQAKDVRNYLTYEFIEHKRPDEEHTYISDILLSGDGDKDTAKQNLKDRGYYLVDMDLNQNAGGHYVYLGYKLTTDFNNAIRGLWVREGEGQNTDVWHDKWDWNLCPYVGSESFCEYKGDLNHRAGGPYLYLYYHKNSEVAKEAIDHIFADKYIDRWNNPKDFIGTFDLNKGAGGSDVFLHTETYGPITYDQTLVNDDRNYYPYCYVLGRKVAVTDIFIHYPISLTYESFYEDRVRGLAAKESWRNSWRNWDDVEIDDFLSRMRQPTLEAELKSAGSAIGSGTGLATKIDPDGPVSSYVLYQARVSSGSLIPWNSNKNMHYDNICEATSSVFSSQWDGFKINEKYSYFYLH